MGHSNVATTRKYYYESSQTMEHKSGHEKTAVFRRFSAGDERIELPPKVLETPIIPFDQSPTCFLTLAYYTNQRNICQEISYVNLQKVIKIFFLLLFLCIMGLCQTDMEVQEDGKGEWGLDHAWSGMGGSV